VAVELHLPDLPEVPISLGPTPDTPELRGRRRQPWHLRLRDALSTYLPLLLMALLALGTWWLVKNTPPAPVVPTATDVRRDPDYTMTQFAIERFDRSGQLRVRVDGDRLLHFPDTDRYEIDQVRIRSLAPDGQVTLAVARRALANGDISEVQLLGGAQVTSQGPNAPAVEIRSEFLHAFLVTERVRTHLAVQVNDGTNQLQASGLEYDHGRRLLELKGRVRAVLAPGKALP
jgi:lipopolysaccharide export system protein LptC